jgi:hypothetical protein
MNYIIDEIDSVEYLGELEQDFFDVGMKDTPHTFFANDILVHNSCFASALPIIKETMLDVDINDDKQMTDAILKVASEVQSFVNSIFDIMSEKMFFLKSHRFDIKQEVIAKSGFWLAKKRYTQWIINKASVECDELEIKGFDVVRTSFPIKFRAFMKDFLIDLLKKVDRSVIDEKILRFESELNNVPVIELAKNTSVRFVSLDKGKHYDPPNRVMFNFVLGTPAQVKAGLAYNDIIDFWKLDKVAQKIINGQKIKWVYLIENDYGIDSMAIKADGTDPKEIIDFVDKYIDRHLMYTQELKSKLIEFYNVLTWVYPDECTQKAESMFDLV